MIKLVVAMDPTRVIGFNNALPWHLPDDLRHFRQTTLNSPIIMGRTTFESFPKPLPNRKHIVVTHRSLHIAHDDVFVASSIEEAVSVTKTISNGISYVIGGASIYQQFLDKNLIDEMIVTEIKQEYCGDTFFPNVDGWILHSEEEFADFYIRRYLCPK